MDKKCERYSRCLRCRKLNFKRETTKYQDMRKELFENGRRDSCENLIVCDSFIKSLLNQRAKLGRLARGIENARRKIREPTADVCCASENEVKETPIPLMGHIGVGEDELC